MRSSAWLAAACLLVGLFLAGSGIPAWAAGQPQLPLARASLGAVQVELELATTPQERFHGLSGREGLAPGRGMAFLFPGPGRWAMVMRGMRFALDFVWLRDNRVVGVTAHVSPPQEVDMVIELPAGFAQAQGLTVGQRLVWGKKK